MNLDNFFKKQTKETKIALSVSALGLLLFFALAFTLPFNSKVFKDQYPKPRSFAAGAVILSLLPPSKQALFNEQFDINVDIDTQGEQVTGVNLYVKFDPNFLQGVSINEGSFLPTVLKTGTINNTEGIASIQLASSVTAPKSGVGTLAVVKFQAKTIPINSSLISISSASPDEVITPNNTWVGALGKSGINVLGTSNPSNIAVLSLATPTPRPTIVATAPPPSQPCALTQAKWGNTTNPVPSGTVVSITIVATGDCNDKQLSFIVKEDDQLAGTSSVSINPVSANFTFDSINNNYKASSSWKAEYHQDGRKGVDDPPEYFFTASVVGGTQTIKSALPELQVTKTTGKKPRR